MDFEEKERIELQISRRRFDSILCQTILPTACIALGAINLFRRSFSQESAQQEMGRQDASPKDPLCDPGNLGITLLVTLAMIRNGSSARCAAVERSLRRIESCIRTDGGIYSKDLLLANHETCSAVLCLQEVDAERYDAILQRAIAFLRKSQYNQDNGVHPSDCSFGGLDCGPKHVPDLCTTALFLDVLKMNGASPQDQAIQDALVFISRCQNGVNLERGMRSASPGDGGFCYTCANGDAAQVRSMSSNNPYRCGMMTYYGLKSMIDASLAMEDPRMCAVMAWVRKHYTLKNNPGLGEAGIYHYYYACSRALDALGVDDIEDASGKMHPWRKELAAEIIRRQRNDGTWRNDNDLWMEDQPTLATAYALLALSYCQPSS